MSGAILADTGVVVAYLLSAEKHHEWARRVFEQLTQPMETCEAVIAESCFLLRHSAIGLTGPLTLLSRGILTITFQLPEEIRAVEALMRKYGDLPMSLADACLVRMAERRQGSEIATLDRHFRVYRTSERKVIRVRMPPDLL
jgi:predicted nucleic acid-binding protein